MNDLTKNTMLISNRVSIINNIHIGHMISDHQTNDKAKVAAVAAAAAPKTRISNPVIAPDVLVDWEVVGPAEVDKGEGLALVTTVVKAGVALPVVLPVMSLVAVTEADELVEFDAMDDANIEIEAAKVG